MERAAKLQRVEPIHPAPAPQTAVIVVNTPDSWSFQHFLDRASHVITQAAHLSYNKPTPKVLTGRRPSGPVSALWDRMGYSDRVHETRTQTHAIQAASLIWPCRSVLIHPYLSWRIAEMMRMPWALNTSFNSSKKKTVSLVLFGYILVWPAGAALHSDFLHCSPRSPTNPRSCTCHVRLTP